MFKRSLAAACISALVVVGVAPAASAAPRSHHRIASVIDWDAPSPTAPSGPTTSAIDWD
ncbi:hypothetical protein [Aeromicrobium panaciterrae]|uniref:hypothetical protein n=1 Tax=Aeromicrobium panaciterrae TaxID=363861 RepID=UPI0031E17AC1